jgi:NitT/TauT family transport system substrate-binding protein
MVGKIYKLFIGLMVLGLVLTACASTGSNEGELPDLGTIKVGYVPVIGYAPLYIAVEKGYFQEQGLDVEIERFVSGAKMIAPLSTGQLDVGTGETGTALLNGAQQGLDVMSVCNNVTLLPGQNGFPFLIRADLYESGEVTEPADLRGRKIGVNIERGITEYVVSKILEAGGLTIDDVELVAIPFPDMPVALANAALDAALVPNPLGESVIRDGSAVALPAYDEIAGEVLLTVIYFGKRFLEPENREVAVRFLEVWLKTLREILDSNWSNEEDLAMISEYVNLPPELIQATVKSYYDPNCEFFYSSLEDIQDYYLVRGYVEFSEPLPFSEFIDETFMDEALKRIGEYQE